jgi:hypothetical protein
MSFVSWEVHEYGFDKLDMEDMVDLSVVKVVQPHTLDLLVVK